LIKKRRDETQKAFNNEIEYRRKYEDVKRSCLEETDKYNKNVSLNIMELNLLKKEQNNEAKKNEITNKVE
jgi:hypothetical protein